MEENIALLRALATVGPDQTFSFVRRAPMPRTSWTTSLTKHYYRENRRTMLEGLTTLIDEIDQRKYQLVDIRNRELTSAILDALDGLRRLAVNYEDDREINTTINEMVVRLTLVCNRINKEVVDGVTITAERRDESGREGSPEVEVDSPYDVGLPHTLPVSEATLGLSTSGELPESKRGRGTAKYRISTAHKRTAPIPVPGHARRPAPVGSPWVQ